MLPAIAHCSALEGIAVNGTLRSVSGLPFCYLGPQPLRNSKLKFTALEFGLAGSEEVGDRVAKPVKRRP